MDYIVIDATETDDVLAIYYDISAPKLSRNKSEMIFDSETDSYFIQWHPEYVSVLVKVNDNITWFTEPDLIEGMEYDDSEIEG